MTSAKKSATSSFWVSLISLAILACLGGVIYTFVMIQQEAGEEGEYRAIANDLRLQSQQVVARARETAQGEQRTFDQLATQVTQFNVALAGLENAGLDAELEEILAQWAPIRDSAQTLVDAGPRIVFIHGVSGELEKNIRPIQSEFAAVVDILLDESVSSDTVSAAQKTLWLTERIARNIDKILAGGAENQRAADEFRMDAADFNRTVDALRNGNKVMGVQRIADPDAIDAIDGAAEQFSVVSASVEQIAEAAPGMRAAAAARQSIAVSNAQLSDAISALVPAIDRMTNARMYDRSTLMVLFGAPAVLAVALLILMFRNQRRRVIYTEAGVADVNSALLKIAEGDLTVQAPEENTVTRDIAREINASTGRQRQLIRNIRTPFEIAVDEINKIGKTAQGQVEKGKELTRSVVESTTAATEMVRTSEQIKAATVKAAQTSERNRLQVARGYELTKDMSKASADVREAVQETSKSAKRQGELIQSVTTAAEYIQALNTKISVVAINTRIEAEKAGEHGRPFLGIAEAIGDLLREAEEEGRKIISEVRMLQNLSAENLSSMENTVGTVVTILEYIDRLDASLEEINEGSNEITAIINSVDDAAGQSADSAQHMNSSMAEIRERNLDISEYSEHTQGGVSALQQSMRAVAENLSQFRIEEDAAAGDAGLAELDGMEHIPEARRIYDEREMEQLEHGEDREKVSV
ncbi:methyl-accepting chemotaxis protein [Parahaliea mediterranea]|uniref:Methyl-accepting chemotaxis protein n=1 Tax=Parahaliea mediterranea TaxID=651086 RepID=A0A939DFG3_9GAMM|nr:methyl-accepting chemotaxis protein [Parahaliea mediterranea]MBN7797140.1 methyl-accepting chemotaxis protein [Parahaliea mediterranea]